MHVSIDILHVELSVARDGRLFVLGWGEVGWGNNRFVRNLKMDNEEYLFSTKEKRASHVDSELHTVCAFESRASTLMN